MSSTNDTYLFEEEKLKQLSEWNNFCIQLSNHSLIARPLKLQDYDKGYLELLSQLTLVGQVSRAEFTKRFQEMKTANSISPHYYIVVIEDTKMHKIIGTSTLFLEMKFIHHCAMRGRLEDVAVLSSYRGCGIGEVVVKIIVELARETFKCYKLTLDCSDDLIKFYGRNNFLPSGHMLCIRF